MKTCTATCRKLKLKNPNANMYCNMQEPEAETSDEHLVKHLTNTC
jgi:hypothetical protein